jgi:hypothetical protein
MPPRPPRLTRRFPAAMTDDAVRKLRRFATAHGLSENEALTFVFENLDAIAKEDMLAHRMTQFRAALEAGRTGGEES